MQSEYPELLDLLAWKFSHPKDQGGFSWDVKSLLKFIMTSNTYQQRSLADGKTMVNDPTNNWLARGPRHRLSAEMIRDAALSVSGLLDETHGGPPVRPYDIAESFKPEKISSGTSLYRRVFTHIGEEVAQLPCLRLLTFRIGSSVQQNVIRQTHHFTPICVNTPTVQ